MRNVIIILNYNDSKNTIELIDRIKNYQFLFKIVVVDNMSTDNSYERLIGYSSSRIHIIRSDKNGGYSYGNNFGVLYSLKNFNGIDNFIISNPDVSFHDQSIFEMCEALNSRPDAALVGLIVKRPSGEIDSCFAWHYFNYDMLIRSVLKLYAFLRNRITKTSLLYNYDVVCKNKIFDVDVVHGCFFMIRASILVKIGLFDEGTFLYCEEDIISSKLRCLSDNCRKEIVLTDQFVVHKGSESINKAIKKKKALRNLSLTSRLYYMKNYLHTSKIKIWLYRLLWRINGK